jgi:hypothetical protein
MTYNIFNSRGEFCPMPADERDALAPAELAAYEAVLDAAAKCEVAEQLVISLESQIVAQTADIRAMESKLAKYPKPSRIDLVRHVLMRDGI